MLNDKTSYMNLRFTVQRRKDRHMHLRSTTAFSISLVVGRFTLGVDQDF